MVHWTFQITLYEPHSFITYVCQSCVSRKYEAILNSNKNDTLTTRNKRFYYILKEKEVLSTSTLNSQLEDNLFFFNFLISANRIIKFEWPNVIEIFLHSCDKLTLKILYDVLGLGQTPWWRLCWRSACRISCISAYHGSIQVFLWSWDVHDRHP